MENRATGQWHPKRLTLLGKVVRELLKQVRSKAAARAASDAVAEDEALEAVAAVRFAVNHVKEGVMNFRSLVIA